MGPVAVAILATILPTCLLIFGLVCLSIYLRTKLRASRAESEELRVQLPPTTEGQSAPAEQEPWPREVPTLGPDPSVLLSDASNPDWRRDVGLVNAGLSCWGRFVDWEEVYNGPNVESWAGKILEALGYRGASPAVILQLLRKKKTRLHITEHIANSVALARTSFESEPESTLLPFSPEVQRDLWTCFKALEGMKFSPELSSIFSKIPSQIASEHGGINEENLKKTVDGLVKLFIPIAELGKFIPVTLDCIREAFTDAVTVRVRMLGSRQQFEFRWDETNETTVCGSPALYSHAGEDGVPLDEPKLWRSAHTMDILEDGSISYRERIE